MLDLLRWLLGVPVLAFLLYVPGAVVLNSLSARGHGRAFFAGVDEWLFSAVLISFLTTGLVAFILAEVGWFHWWLILGLVTLVSLLVGIWLGGARPRLSSLLPLLAVPPAYPRRAVEGRLSRYQSWALIALILVAGVLFSRPAEMLRGALDSGAYINAGVALARSGSIIQRDRLLRELDNDRGEIPELLLDLNDDRFTLDKLRMPAFYVFDKQAAEVLPQHYNLYPVWIALLHSLFGIWGALYATPLLAMLAVLAVYFFARRALGSGPALVSLLLLVLCPVTIWFARYPVSEVITALLAFSAFFAFMRMVQLASDKSMKGDADTQDQYAFASDDARLPWSLLWGVISGACLGQIALARPDFIFYLAPMPAYLLYWRLSRRWRPAYTWFASTLGAFLLLYLVHFVFYSFAYTLDLYHNTMQHARRLWGPLLVAFYVGVALLIVVDRLYPRLKPLWVRVESLAARYRRVWVGALILGLVVYVLYNYLYAPWQPNNRQDDAGNVIPQAIATSWESFIGAPVDEGSRFNLVRIGWYLSPLGLLLGAAGLLRWTWDRLNAATSLFFMSVLISGFVFIQETYTSAHYIYTMRRYLPVVLPALILGAAWAAGVLWSRVRPRPLGWALAGMVVIFLSGFFAYTSRVIIPHVEERGAVAQLSDLAARFDEKSVLLFSSERDEPYVVATPLQYIHGIESFVLARTYPNVDNTVLQGVVDRWQSQGYKVWVLMGANAGKLFLDKYSFQKEGEWEYRVPEFEQLYQQKPTNVSEAFLPWGIYSLQPRGAPPAWPFNVDIGDSDYQWLVSGWNKQERDTPQAPYWRWTGSHPILRVPWPTTVVSGTSYFAGTIRLRLRPETPQPGKPLLRPDPVTLKLSLDGTPVGEIAVAPGTDFAEYTIDIPAGIPKTEKDPDYALLHINSPTWSGASAGISYDARALGIQVDQVIIER